MSPESILFLVESIHCLVEPNLCLVESNHCLAESNLCLVESNHSSRSQIIASRRQIIASWSQIIASRSPRTFQFCLLSGYPCGLSSGNGQFTASANPAIAGRTSAASLPSASSMASIGQTCTACSASS